MTQSAMGGAPFVAGKPAGGQRPAATPARTAAPFDCEIPEGWAAAQAGAMQMAVYEVRDGDRQVAISVSSAGGDLAANVNRWRQQVQLAPLVGADLEKEMHRIKVDSHDGTYVEAIGPATAKDRETIPGVIVEAQGRQWFSSSRVMQNLRSRKTAFQKVRAVQSGFGDREGSVMATIIDTEETTQPSYSFPRRRPSRRCFRSARRIEGALAEDHGRIIRDGDFHRVAGTMAQTRHDIWDVVHTYFRSAWV